VEGLLMGIEYHEIGKGKFCAKSGRLCL
jgi:hypothetical protein